MTTELTELKKKTIDSMVSYMKYGSAADAKDPEYAPNFDAGYTQKHVDQYSRIIDELFASLGTVSDAKRNEIIMKVEKAPVTKLNRLNEQCDGSLIETDKREDLCELIRAAAKQAGLESQEGDITQEWHEW